MELKEFVESVLVQLDEAVQSARTKTARDIKFAKTENSRSVEFDIAVSVEQEAKGEAEGIIKVLELVSAGGEMSIADKNQTVSRVSFGLEIDRKTKEESAADKAMYMNQTKKRGALR